MIVRKRGGRFLKRDDSGDYFEIGDKKAESKAAQALREGMEVRATTRKRKEILFQERELEIERRKVMRLSHSSREEHVYISEDQREMYPSRKFVYSSSIDEGKYNCRDNNSSHMCIDQQYNSSYPTSAFVSPMRNTARPSTKAPSDEKQLERRTIAHSFDDDEQEGIVPIEENDFLRYVFAA
uniref:DUF6824 domain-containing protein n=1 Tax=Helicotheca tamesis TaxID=374047 RepID=A0A7S2HWA9_9STRA